MRSESEPDDSGISSFNDKDEADRRYPPSLYGYHSANEMFPSYTAIPHCCLESSTEVTDEDFESPDNHLLWASSRL